MYDDVITLQETRRPRTPSHKAKNKENMPYTVELLSTDVLSTLSKYLQAMNGALVYTLHPNRNNI